MARFDEGDASSLWRGFAVIFQVDGIKRFKGTSSLDERKGKTGRAAEIDKVKESVMAVMEMEEGVMDGTVEGPREKLRQIIEKNGETILQDPDRVEGLLRDHCGSYRKEISALVGALNERVPLELKGSWQSAMTPEAMRARLVQRLEDHRGLAPEVSAWAVDTWSYALGIGLGRRSDRLDSVVIDNNSQFKKQGGIDGVVDGGVAQDKLSKEEERRRAIESDRPGGAAAVAGTAGAAGLLATVVQDKKKAGVGVGALALLAVAAVAMFNHKPTPPAPTPTPTPTPVAVVKPVPVPTPTPTPVPPAPVVTAIAAGTPISIRLNQGIDSDATTVGQTFTATLAAPLTLGNQTVLPTGADATIKVTSIDPGHKVSGQTVMMLSLVQLSSGGKTYKVSSGPVEIDGPKQAVKAAERAGVGAVIGTGVGYLGGLVGHHKKAGAIAGGTGGAVIGTVTTKVEPAKAKPEQLLHFKLVKPLTVNG